jgi:hypothetical protein
MIDNLGVCKGSGTILCEFRVGSTGVQLSKIGKCFYALVNKRVVLSAKSEKDLLSKGLPVVALIIKNLMKTAQVDEMRWKPLDKNYTHLFNEALKGVSETMVPAEVFVLKLKPDEIEDNSIVDASVPSLNDSMEDYKTQLRKFSETVECEKHGAEILLRTNLDKSMWGSKDVMVVLAGIKAEMDPFYEASEMIEGCFEHAGDQIDYIQRCFERKLATGLVNGVISKVIENFSNLKSYMSGIVQACQGLYTIDKIFKNRVGYPATWFFNGSTYMDFLFDHENMIDHLIKMASIETNVIEPLLVRKMTGAK